MSELDTFWRDIKITFQSVWKNLLLFFLLLVFAAALLQFAYPQASRLELLVDVFHMAMLERVVQEGDGTLPLILTLALPLLTVGILGEGVLRVLSIFMARDEHREEWDRMMAKTMRNHLVICGVGELGRALVQQLLASDSNLSIVLIDSRTGIMGELGREYPNVCHIVADMTNTDSLKAANCMQAHMIFLTSGSDTFNLEAANKVIKLNPQAEVWVRLYRGQLAELFNGQEHSHLHFFCPYQDAAQSLVANIKIDQSDRRDNHF